MLSVDVCNLPATGGSTFVVVAGLFLFIAGVVVTRWVRASAGRMSAMVAPLVLLGGLALAPSVNDPCATTSAVATTSTVVSTATAATIPSTMTSPIPSTSTTTSTATTTTTTTTTTIALSCANGGVCTEGDPGPSGGIVIYGAGSTQSWGRYLEAACAGWSDGTCGGSDLVDPYVEWGCRGPLLPGAVGTAIGTGEQNTTDIVDPVNGCQTAGIAARLAHDLVLGGQSDWFLPAKDELNQMYIQKTPSDGFTTGRYWTSTQYDRQNAWNQKFEDGNQSFGRRDNIAPLYVRPVRAF